MSDEKAQHSSEKSRQHLLDELYYAKDVAGEREQRILRLQALIAEKDAALAGKDAQLAENDAALAEKDAALAEQDAEVADKDAALADIHALLELMVSSRSWRWTVPLRALARWLGASRSRRSPAPDTSPAATTAVPAITIPSTVESEPAATSGDPAQAENEGPPRLFVDISELAIKVGQTGVQRVVREVLRALLASPPAGYTVEPVFAAPGQPFRYARAFVSRLTGGAHPSSAPEQVMQVRAGDVFLGLDHSMQAVAEHASEFEAMHRDGVSVYFVCNDTLPLSRPDCFPPVVHEAFKTWLETIATVGEGIVCISRATESELRRWLDTLQPPRGTPLALGHFHLGADIVPREADTAAITPEQAATLEQLHGMPSFLMVGTVEPRKGHAQALEAFESLWARGESVALVLVGLPGWMTEVTQRRIRHHEEFGQRLIWLMEANDALLEKLYASCTALLAPSEGEGFGLPLVEAARHGLPVLCRELPVFREVAGEHATYFTGNDAVSLADAIERWLASHRNGTAPASTDMPRLTWAQSTQQLLDVMLGGHWDEHWPSAGMTNKELQHPRKPH